MIALAGCYDALVTSRSYKPAVSHSQAAQMIVSGEYGAFCPAFSEYAALIPIEVYGKGPVHPSG